MSWQRYWPKSFSDRVALTFVLFMVPYIAIYQCFYMLPKYYEPLTLPYLLHVAAGFYVLINVAGNLQLLLASDASIRGRLLLQGSGSAAQRQQHGWRFCSACECSIPPRTFHCHECDTCVLKRDHHCMFTGQCVGHDNHRYYLMTVSYFAVAALYAAFFNLSYLIEMHGGVTALTIFRITLPFMALVMQLSSLWQAWIALTNMLCLLGGSLVIALGIYHWQLALKNQTTYEQHKRIQDFDLGWRQNLRSCLGARWYCVWVCPWIASPLPDDGITFRSRSGKPVYETVKGQ